MEQTFEDYLKQARKDFAKVASEYTVTEHLKLRTAIDSLLIAYDQAVNKALTIPVVVDTSVCDEPDEPIERCKCCKSFHEPDVCCYD
tara:strand:+ start:3579 stop:3839 length:261 start_codon:yes stop_codon:yes gene_type:complete